MSAIILDVESATPLNTTQKVDTVDATIVVSRPNNTSPGSTIDDPAPLIRMHVRPYFPFLPNYRIIRLNSQNWSDPVGLPLSSLLSSSSSFHDSELPQITDEWKSIWQRLHIFMKHDEVITEDNIISESILLVISITISIIFLSMITLDSYDLKELYLFGLCSILNIILVFVIYGYRIHGDPNYRLGNLREVPKFLQYVIISLIFFVFSTTYIENDFLASCGLFALLVLFGFFMYVLFISCCIPILMSLRNYRVRLNQTLKKIYYEIKNMNHDNSELSLLHYFTLHPKLNFDNSSIVVNVYWKVPAVNDHRGDSDTDIEAIVSPTPSIDTNMLGVTQRRGGGGGGGIGSDGSSGENDNGIIQSIYLEKDNDLSTPLLQSNDDIP